MGNIEIEFIEAVDRWLKTESEDDYEDADWLAHFIIQTLPQYKEFNTIRKLYEHLTGKEIG
jgi:hypothetical protein